jgi:hypothetical protein
VSRPDALEGPRRRRRVGEDDLLRVRGRGEEPPDRIARQLPGEEQPVHRAVERELGGRAGEDQEDHVAVAPDRPHDGVQIDERCGR